jgi:hypothetical protein
VLQLDYDTNRGNRTFDIQTLNALLTSTALVDPAAEKALKLAADQWPAVVQLEVVPAGTAAVRLGVTVTHDGQGDLPPDAARVMLEELAARAKTVVDAAGSRQEKLRVERLNRLQADLAAAAKELDRISTKLREAMAAGEAERAAAVKGGVRGDRDRLEIDLRAQRARLAVLEAERERVVAAAAATAKPAGQALPPPWADLIAARERIVALVRELEQVEGPQKALALAQAEAALAEARALAAADRREVDPAERWQAEIVTLKASIAETEARLAAINERFPKALAAQPAPPPDEVDQLRQDEAMARKKVNELRQLVDAARQDERNSETGPTLHILDGKGGS